MERERLMTQYRTIRVPEDLCAKAEKLLPSRFTDLEALITYLLEEVVRDDASKIDQEEEQFLQQRLKDLGYL
jgi:hypothetical protein